MLNTLHIQNYRLFKDLTINNLGQVNLIAGKNNTGKTALLEAIILGNSVNIQNLLYAFMSLRGELDNSSINSYDIFKVIGINQDFIRVNNIYIKPRENDKWTTIVFDSEKNKELTTIHLSSKIENNHIDNLFTNDREQFIFIPFYSSFNTATLWENIDLTPLKQDLISIMQCIEEKVSDVGIDIRTKQPKVLLQGQSKAVPLKRFGDGMGRFFSLALALVNAQEKILLIDEFEVGLHHSIQEKLWEIIFEYAAKWNIQVFVTTHSLDTVRSFYYAANQSNTYQKMANYFTLNHSDSDDIEAINYDFEELETAF